MTALYEKEEEQIVCIEEFCNNISRFYCQNCDKDFCFAHQNMNVCLICNNETKYKRHTEED